VSTISECAKLINETSENEAKNAPNVRTTPPDFPNPSEEFRVSTHSRLREACDELLYLVTGPHEHLMAIAQAHRIEAALQYACHFHLASFVPTDGSSITFSDLSVRAEVPTQQCARILRLLMTCHIFYEPDIGSVAHTPESRLLLDGYIEAAVSYYTDESFRAGSFLSCAAEKWPNSQERNETALNMAYGTSLPKFEFFAAEPWRAHRFRKAMAGMARGERFSLEHLVNGFDWQSLPDGSTVVDIGGSTGHCSMALATANPGLRFIVQDLRSGFDRRELPESMTDRVQFMEHDFFTPQPVSADVYILRWILHDYPDKFACKILQAQIYAMRPGAKIIVMEGVMMQPGTQSKLDERKLRTLDIAMMSLLNSVERDIAGWMALFQQAEPRLRLINVIKPPGSALSVMELELAST